MASTGLILVLSCLVGSVLVRAIAFPSIGQSADPVSEQWLDLIDILEAASSNLLPTAQYGGLGYGSSYGQEIGLPSYYGQGNLGTNYGTLNNVLPSSYSNNLPSSYSNNLPSSYGNNLAPSYGNNLAPSYGNNLPSSNSNNQPTTEFGLNSGPEFVSSPSSQFLLPILNYNPTTSYGTSYGTNIGTSSLQNSAYNSNAASYGTNIGTSSTQNPVYNPNAASYGTNIGTSGFQNSAYNSNAASYGANIGTSYGTNIGTSSLQNTVYNPNAASYGTNYLPASAPTYKSAAISNLESKYTVPNYGSTVTNTNAPLTVSNYQPPVVPSYVPPAVSNYSPPVVPNYAPPAVPNYQPPVVSNYQPPVASNYGTTTGSNNGVIATQTDGTLNNQATLNLVPVTKSDGTLNNESVYPKYQMLYVPTPCSGLGSAVNATYCCSGTNGIIDNSGVHKCCLTAGTSCTFAPDKCCNRQICRAIGNPASGVHICRDPSYVDFDSSVSIDVNVVTGLDFGQQFNG